MIPPAAIGACALAALVFLLAACTEGGSSGEEPATTESTAGDDSGPEGNGETAPPETGAGASTGATAPAEPAEPEGPTLRVGLGDGPRTLDPAAARDEAAGTVLTALFDPLVRLEDGTGVVPALAGSWDVLDSGRRIVFHLRPYGVWSNGDPVTAQDFEYAWKRAMAPRFANANAELFAEVVGATRYTSCEEDCAGLRDGIGVEALDDLTLEVRLKRPAPWFVQRAAHWAFLPVHEPTIAQHKRRWTQPANIVTNGAFTLADFVPRASFTLERWDRWRDASSIQLARIEGTVVGDRADGLAAFEAGELDACLEDACLPADDVSRLAGTPEFATFPAPVTAYVGVNTERVPSPGQRRGIALALNRQALVVEAAPGVEAPATSLTPAGVPGFEAIETDYLTERARRGKARRFVKRSEDVKQRLVLAYPEGREAVAERLEVQLGKVGLEVELDQRDEEQLAGADLFLASATAEDADALDVLGHFVCDASENHTGFCNPEYDRLVQEARTTTDEAERYALYGQLEAMLTGRQGDFPAIPVYWGTLDVLRQPTVEGFEPNLFGVADLTGVTMTGTG